MNGGEKLLQTDTAGAGREEVHELEAVQPIRGSDLDERDIAFGQAHRDEVRDPRCELPVGRDGFRRFGVDAGRDARLGFHREAEDHGIGFPHGLEDGDLPVLPGDDVLIPPDRFTRGEQVIAELGYGVPVVMAVGEEDVLLVHGRGFLGSGSSHRSSAWL